MTEDIEFSSDKYVQGLRKSIVVEERICIYVQSPQSFFFNTIFVSSHMYPENPEGTQVIVGSMNMGYISDAARNRTHNLFRPKREPIPLGHSDEQFINHHHFNAHFFSRLIKGIDGCFPTA